MLEIAKATVEAFKEGYQQERQRPKQEELSKKKKDANKKREEQEKIAKERERLIGLSTHELIVEAVIALRGLYSRYEYLESYCNRLDGDIEDLETEIKKLKAKNMN